MKGITKVQLFDNGREIYNQEETNMVTDLVYDFYNQIGKLNPILIETSMYSKYALMTDIEYLINGGGILLYEDVKEENKHFTYDSRAPFASAGSNYNNTESDRGSFNTNESTEIIKDDKVIGLKMVWDFPTHCANGTFQNICLTRREFGDKLINPYVFFAENPADNSNIFPVRISTTIPCYPNKLLCSSKMIKSTYEYTEGDMIRNKVSLGYSGEIYLVDGNKIQTIKSSKIDLKNIPGRFSAFHQDVDEEFIVEGYSDLCKVVDDHIDGIFITVGLKIETNKWNIIKIDKITKMIIEEIELTNILLQNDTTNNEAKFNKIINFGITGDILIYNAHLPGRNFQNYIPRYNVKTRKQLPSMYAGNWSNNANYYIYHSCINMIKDYDGNYMVLIASNPPYESYTYSNTILLKEDELLLSYTGDTGSDKYSKTSHPLMNFGVSNLGIGMRFYPGEISPCLFGRPLFTINNLAQPVEKTEANTMKITYTIMWDE